MRKIISYVVNNLQLQQASTSGKFTMALKSCVSGTDIVTLQLAIELAPDDIGMVMDREDPMCTAVFLPTPRS